MEFAEWLKNRLAARDDLNQAKLAILLGVYASTVHYWLKGRSVPDDANVLKLAEIFDEEPAFLYQLLGRMVPQQANGLDLKPEETKIFNDLIELRETRVYEVTIAAIKAVLVIATQEADSPDGR